MSQPTQSTSTVDGCPLLKATHLDIDCAFPLPTPFTLDHTILEGEIQVKARLVGPEHAPVILVLGGISANRNVCDGRDEAGNVQLGWWRDFAGTNQVLDIQQYRILSFDFLPGDADIQNASLTITPQDQARVAKVVCDYFGIIKLHAFVGYSYGGMIALSFGQLFPERVERLFVTCAAHRPHPMGMAWRGIQRKIVRFGLETGQPEQALALARELGMTTYRTSEEFGQRFSAITEVEEYLESRGQAFIGKMSSFRYLSLSQSIDLHTIDPAQISVPVTLLAFRQDRLVPIEEARLLRQQLRTVSRYVECDSLYGHDAALKETAIVSQVLRQALSP